jgi:hypothetical protein
MSNLKQKLVDKLIEVLKQDIESGDTTVLDEILMKCPTDLLLFSLPEEEWGKFKNALEVNPTKAQKGWIKQANKYLHFNEDGSDQAVLDIIAKIRDYENQIQTVDVALSEDDDVFVIEKFEYNFTCKDFLVLIGYHSK